MSAAVGTIVVRLMAATDAERVAALCGQLGYPSTPGDVRSRFEILRVRPDEGMFVAVERNATAAESQQPEGGATDGEFVVGWVHVRPTLTLESNPSAEIAGLVVDARCRGRGVGGLLVRAAEQWAADDRFAEVRVRSNVVRREAHDFYRHLGYEVVKSQLNFRKALPGRSEQ